MLIILKRLSFALLLGALPALADVPLVVEAISVKTVSSERAYPMTGEIVAQETLSASFASGGRIASIAVQEGDKIQAGTVLARIESVQQEQALRAAQAGVLTAQTDQAQAIEDYNRQVALLARGATTRIARDDAADAMRISEGTLAQAQSELDRARKAIADTVLIAPSAATVTDRLAEPGQVVGAAQPVIELVLGTAVDAVFDVPEVLMTAGIRSQVVRLSPLANASEQFSGTVREISPLVDLTKGTVRVKVGVKDKPDSLNYGDPVRGSVGQINMSAIALPYTAMSSSSDGPAVWVVDPKTMAVSLQHIMVERFETGQIIVASGLEDGMVVVTRGAQLLYPGRIVVFSQEEIQ